MKTWGEFESEAPALAETGRRLIYQHGPALAFLGTVRKDGGPRIHPICPVVTDGGLYLFIVEMSYKYSDLLRDPRFALHSFPTEKDEEFYATGEAYRLEGAEARAKVVAAAHEVGLHPQDFEMLFETRLANALHTTWHNHAQPDTWPAHEKWRA